MNATEYIPVGCLPGLLPGRPAISTVWRWATRGIRGVRLRLTRVGGRAYVSRGDLDAFIAAINAPSASAAGVPKPGADAERAMQELGVDVARR